VEQPAEDDDEVDPDSKVDGNHSEGEEAKDAQVSPRQLRGDFQIAHHQSASDDDATTTAANRATKALPKPASKAPLLKPALTSAAAKGKPKGIVLAAAPKKAATASAVPATKKKGTGKVELKQSKPTGKAVNLQAKLAPAKTAAPKSTGKKLKATETDDDEDAEVEVKPSPKEQNAADDADPVPTDDASHKESSEDEASRSQVRALKLI